MRTFHTQSKNRNNIKRDIGRHIYFMEDNLLYAIFKLRHVLFNVVIKVLRTCRILQVA